MSSPDENELLETLFWSDNDYDLEKFLERFKLPQLVRVEVGYFTTSERTSLGSGQVLLLHSVEKTKKLVCKTSFNNTMVVIPLDCPLKVLVVLPRSNECRSTEISARQLASLCSGDVSASHIIKYVITLDGYLNLNTPKESLEIDEILEIKHVDFADCSIKFTNMATGQTESIPLDSDVLLAPLLDCRPYTLAEVKQAFGLPVNVRFLYARAPAAAGEASDASMLVSSLGEVAILKEIEQILVVSSTVGGTASDPRLKACLKITNDLPVQVAAVRGSIQGAAGENYHNIVDTLDKTFKRTRLEDSRHLYIYEHLDAVKEIIYDISSSVVFDEQPSDAEVRRSLSEFRSRDVDYGPAPPLPPKLVRRQSDTTSPPSSRRAPKPKKTQSAQETQSSQITPPKSGPKPPVQYKFFSLPGMGQRLKPEGRSASVNDELDRKVSTVERWRGTLKSDFDQCHAFLQPRDTFEDEPIYEIPYAKSNSGTDTGGSTCVDTQTFILKPPHSTPVPAAATAQNSSQASPLLVKSVVFPNAKHPSRDNSGPVPAYVDMENNSIPISPLRGSDKNDETLMTGFPNDLSCLSVRQVGELLTALHMDCYVNVFREEFVDGELLKSLDRESLESLGVPGFHVKKLVKFIEGWRPNF